MWLILAFLSAALLGFYDAFKKKSLRGNAVLPVLFLNTLFCSLVFLPFILCSAWMPGVLEGTMLYVPAAGWEVHKYVLLKSFIVLGSWARLQAQQVDIVHRAGRGVGRGERTV